MDDKKLMDTANEPVNRDEEDAEFMDTGVLHEKKKGVKGAHASKVEDNEADADK